MILITLFIALQLPSLAAAEGTSAFADALVRTGFVNVRAVPHEGDVIVAAENRRYRSPARALAEMLRLGGRHLSDADSLHMVLEHQGMPVLRLSTHLADVRGLLDGSLPYQAWSARSTATMEVANVVGHLRGAPRQGRVVLRSWDVAVGSTVRYQLGNYGSRSDNYRVAVDLEPELRLDLPAGMQARARLAVPVWNNLDNNTHVRPAVLSLSRPFRASEALFGVVSAGVFTRNRAGVHASLMQYVSDERFRIGFDIGHTTFTPLTGRVAFPAAERQDYTVYQAVAGWHLRRHRLDLSARYGMFLYRDQGLRLDMTRSFGDGQVGFFLLSGSNGRNGGFRFRIALPPRTYIRPIPARIRPAEGFELGYRYEGGGFDIREYEAGNRAMIDLSLYYPSLVLFELEQYIAV